MAVAFVNSASHYYSIADHASLTLPASDWFFGFMFQVFSNTGTSDQSFISNNDVSVNNDINVYLRGTASGTNPDQLRFGYQDGAGVGTIIVADANHKTPTNGIPKWGFFRRCAATGLMEVWLAQSGYVSRAVTASIGALSTIDGGAWNIGRRSTGANQLQAGNTMAHVMMGNFAISPEEMYQLANGGLEPSYWNRPLIFYLPFNSSEATVYDLSGNGNHATLTGNLRSVITPDARSFARPSLAILGAPAAPPASGVLLLPNAMDGIGMRKRGIS